MWQLVLLEHFLSCIFSRELIRRQNSTKIANFPVTFKSSVVYKSAIGRILFSSAPSTTLNWLQQLVNGVILVFQATLVPPPPGNYLSPGCGDFPGLNKIEELEWNCFGFSALISLVRYSSRIAALIIVSGLLIAFISGL